MPWVAAVALPAHRSSTQLREELAQRRNACIHRGRLAATAYGTARCRQQLSTYSDKRQHPNVATEATPSDALVATDSVRTRCSHRRVSHDTQRCQVPHCATSRIPPQRSALDWRVRWAFTQRKGSVSTGPVWFAAAAAATAIAERARHALCCMLRRRALGCGNRYGIPADALFTRIVPREAVAAAGTLVYSRVLQGYSQEPDAFLVLCLGLCCCRYEFVRASLHAAVAPSRFHLYRTPPKQKVGRSP